ncbi:protein transport protein Sec24C [Pimephales promelas]|uniref:protein transport protein Sec24C n=1 Tax=Pimephales promelas TaxID=90988 RepID=UPI00195586BC|nr:protein transport protein Sec24C [Pimephales promelas]XP_039515965.1 protein transport protein Sec24C [Pimephales promelas]XP_039515966.1 protein transport protein Sec24C [Pimephales promelas]XP_039515967.1 protein transport protein Sec24C [Pimephales promelas]KAG1958215.1 protein transport protein Sec24C [Pimephales promelas]
MEVPAVNQSFTHPPPQPWAGQSHRTPTMPPASCPPPPYHYPNLNPDPRSAAVSVTPMASATVTTGHRPQSLFWDPSQQSHQDVFKPVPEITNMTTQGMPQRSYSDSLPTSPVSNSKPESRYGLDPQLLPSVVQVIKEDKIQWEGKVFVSEPKSSVPPLSSTQCTLEDRGNATSRFIRCTSYSFPVEAQSAQKSHLPLGAIVCPLASPERGQRDVPVCEAGDCVKGCVHCGAFMSPAMSWQDCGQRFYCPFCDKLSEVSWRSYQPTNQGRRVDWEKKPELSLGSYEILEKQMGKAAVLLMAIDISASAMRTGQLDHICQQISSQLQALNGPDETDQSALRVGLMTYDSRIHLYNLSPALSRPHMMVITDCEELELPMVEGLLVPLKDCIHIAERVLQEIVLFNPESENRSSSQELPVSAGLKILQAAGSPGKLLIFHSSPFSEGTNQKNSSGFFSSSKVKSIFQGPDSSTSLAKECVNQGCCVHMFVFSHQEVGGAWPGHIPFLTGGGLISYDSLQSEMEQERFRTDLSRCVNMQMAFKVQLRVFVSKEMRISGCYGSIIAGPDSCCVSIAAFDCRSALAFEFTHNKSLDETRGVAIQFVLSYISSSGENRTRIHTVILSASHQLLDTFRSTQAETLLTFYCKKMYSLALEIPLQTLREELQTEVTEMLACFRKHSCTSSVSPGQLVIPQFLKAVPAYINSLRKSEVLLPGLRSSVHQRLQLRSLIVSMDTRSTASQFYPLILPLSVSADNANMPSLGEAVRCTVSSLDPGGLYLIYCPLALLLWVGSCVPPHTLLQLFNTSSFSYLTSGEINLPVLENSLSISTRALVCALQSSAAVTLQLKLVREGCEEESLQRLLVEDKSPNGGASYADFLFHLHVNALRLIV